MSRTPMKRIWAILMAFAVVISGMMVQPQTAQAAVKVTSITLSAKKTDNCSKAKHYLKGKECKACKGFQESKMENQQR